MFEKRPLFDDYWESKSMNTERISIPLYVIASFSSMPHSRGSFETFRTASSRQKWLRVHPYQEWYDLYRPEMVDDLQRFFDRFLKEAENGWEVDTPPVRLSLLGFEASGGITTTIRERPEFAWPLPRQTLEKFHLNAGLMALQPQKAQETSSVSYDSQDLKGTSVSFPILSDCQICTSLYRLPSQSLVWRVFTSLW